MTQARLEKERELRVQESILEQVNAQFNTDHLRHQTLKKQTTGTGIIILLMQLNTAPSMNQTTSFVTYSFVLDWGKHRFFNKVQIQMVSNVLILLNANANRHHYNTF